MKKLLSIICFIILNSNVFGTIHVYYSLKNISTSTRANVDIDQDGLWDVKFWGYDNGPHFIQPAFRDNSNYTSLKVISLQEPNPVPLPFNADMNAVGIWVYSSAQGDFEIKDFLNQGDKYIGVRLLKNGVQYCSWIKIVEGIPGGILLEEFAWEDDNTKCMKAGKDNYPSTISQSNSSSLEFSLYPVPADDYLIITGFQSVADVEFINTLGENVLSFSRISPDEPLVMGKFKKYSG